MAAVQSVMPVSSHWIIYRVSSGLGTLKKFIRGFRVFPFVAQQANI